VQLVAADLEVGGAGVDSYHVRDCLKAGCTVEQLCEALNVAVAEGAGPEMVYAGYAVEAVDEWLAAGADGPPAPTPAPDGAETRPPPHRH
jgi:hypothetical protein